MHSVTFLSAAQLGDLLKLTSDPLFICLLVQLLPYITLGEASVSDVAENFVILTPFKKVVIKIW